MSWRIEVKPTAEKQYVKLDKTGRLWMRFASSTPLRLILPLPARERIKVRGHNLRCHPPFDFLPSREEKILGTNREHGLHFAVG